MTPTGFAAALTGGLMLAAGLLLGWAPLVLMGLLLLTAVALAVAVVVLTPNPRLHRAVSVEVVHRHEPALATLVAAGAKMLPAPGRDVVDGLGDRPVAAVVPWVPARAERTVSYALPTDRRGLHTVGPLTVVAEDALGLVRRKRSVGGPGRLRVWPAVHPLALHPRRNGRSIVGDADDASRAGSASFRSLREYVPGDDRRLVHWRSSARTGTLMVREGLDTARPEALVLLDDVNPTDNGSGPGTDPFEEGVDVAASLVAAGLAAGLPVTLATTSGRLLRLNPIAGSLERALDVLSEVRAVDEAIDVAALLSGRSGSIAVLVSASPSRVLEVARSLSGQYGQICVAELGVPAGTGTQGPFRVVGAADAAEWCQLWGQAS